MYTCKCICDKVVRIRAGPTTLSVPINNSQYCVQVLFCSFRINVHRVSKNCVLFLPFNFVTYNFKRQKKVEDTQCV